MTGRAPHLYFLTVLAAACGAERTDDSACAIEPSQVIARADAPSYQGVALDARGKRIVAAYSSRDGLYVRPIDERGVPLATANRIGDPCSGGVDLEVASDRVVVACSRRADGSGYASGVMLYTLDDTLHATYSASLGDAGRDGRGIDVERVGATDYVLYHDGSQGAHTIKIVTITGGHPTERVLSRPGRMAGEPALRLVGNRVYSTWSETNITAIDAQATEVLVQRDLELPRVVQQVSVQDPAPHLTADEHGLVLTYRDKGKLDRKAELYVVRLDDALAISDVPLKVGRANTDGSPSLFACSGSHLALLPREYGGEHYIAIHTLDASLQNTGGHQFYGNSRDYVMSAGSCVGDSLVFLAAERKSPADTGVDIAAMRFACAHPGEQGANSEN
jgi:hypothetical protein